MKLNKSYYMNEKEDKPKINLLIAKAIIYSVPLAISSLINERLFTCVLLRVLKSNGFVFMKIGQWMACRPDLFGPRICNALRELHENAPFHSLEYSLRVLNTEVSVNPRIAEADKIKTTNTSHKLRALIGCGCVAQVYHASLKSSDVAIKILHPKIKQQIISDIYNIKLLLNLMKPFSSVIKVCCDGIDQFKADILKQVNMKYEYENLKILRYNFRRSKNVIIPAPIYYTKNCLVMEYVKTKKNRIVADAAELNNLIAQMVLKDKFIHTDLHSGNVHVDENGKFVLFDAGMCKHLTEREYVNLMDLLYAVYRRNYKKAGKLLIDRMPNQNTVNKAKFTNEFAVAMDKFSSTWKYSDVMAVLERHNILLDHTYNTLITSVICFDGMNRQISDMPYANIGSVLRKYIPYKYIARMYVEAIINIIAKYHAIKCSCLS